VFEKVNDQGAVRQIEIQPDDVADLLDEERILRELERLRPVGLQRERAPNPTLSAAC
jgi:hypothetical protein